MNIYYFNDLEDYDEFNPSYFLDHEIAKKIIKKIGCNPYKYKKEDLYFDNKEEAIFVIDGLTKINALSLEEGLLKINFPTFYFDDINMIVPTIKNNIQQIIDKTNNYCKKLNYNKNTLYHLICNDIFDDFAFDYLADKKLITNNKINPGNRDYIIIGYDDNEKVEKFSNSLLCSNNKYVCGKVTLNSFGDSNGHRRDLFRHFRLKQMNIVKEPIIDFVLESLDNNEDLFKKQIEDVILNNAKHIEIKRLLNNLNYMKGNKIDVTILNKNEHKKIAKDLMELINDDVELILNEIKSLNITSNINNVPYKDTANELWHIIFGIINEALIDNNIVTKPISISGEGRYLKCIYISEEV